MDLTPYLDYFRQELAVATKARGEDVEALAEQLSGPLEAAAQLAFFKALSRALEELNRGTAPGRTVPRTSPPTPGSVPVPHLAGMLSSLDAVSDPIEAISSPPDDHTRREPPLLGRHIRLRFGDGARLASAMALFGPTTSEVASLTLRIPSDGSLRTLCAVLAALDEADLEVDAITVHSASLDDVFSALAEEPQLTEPGESGI